LPAVELLASGRDSDVFVYDDGLVLRRYRDGRSAETEATIVRRPAELGYPAPSVYDSGGPDIVMARVVGPTPTSDRPGSRRSCGPATRT